MNEKERIIELVKQNIISMEEALDLLEAASNAESNSEDSEVKQDESTKVDTETTGTAETKESTDRDEFNRTVENVIREGKNLAKNFGDYFTQMTEKHPEAEVEDVDGVTAEEKQESEEEAKVRKAKIIQIDAELRELNEEFNRRNEALVICNQRLREIEIFEELDGLTDEMETQKISLEDKKLQIEDKINIIQEKTEALMAEKESLGWRKPSKSDFKDIFSTNTEKISEAATQIGKEAAREGKKWGSILSEKSKSFLDNFNLKDLDVSIQVPWIKTRVEEFDFTYPDEDITELIFDSYNGSVEVESYDGSEILIESTVRFHGSHEEFTKEAFLAANTVETVDGQFIFKINSAKTSADLFVRVPKKLYKNIHFNLLNGDVDLVKVEAENISIKDKNGDAYLKDVTVNELVIDFLNGDIEILNSPIDTIVINNLNGDVRINGYINNLSAEAVNGDFLLTKRNEEDANIKIKTVSGDIKLSLPENMNLTVDSKTTHGEIKNRLSNLDTIDDVELKSKGHYHRIVADQTNHASVSISTTSGDIYLKDSNNKV